MNVQHRKIFTHLDNIKQVLFWNNREVDLMGRVYDGMDFGDLIGDVLERSLSISHIIEDTSQ